MGILSTLPRRRTRTNLSDLLRIPSASSTLPRAARPQPRATCVTTFGEVSDSARHERTSKDKHKKHTVTDTLQQQLRTMMSAIQGRKAFVQCAILVAVVLLALTANAAAQEHRRHGGRHSPRPHHGHDPWCDHHHCGWPNHSRSRHGKKWRHIGKKWRQAWG